MKHWMRVCILLLAFLLTMSVPVSAYQIPTDFTDLTIEQAMEDFMQAYGLNAGNFSVSYCNTVSGERYAFNDKEFMVAASTFKLPLNMYYYELEQAGTIAPDAYISRVGGTLNEAHYQSLVNSDNAMSIGMLYNLGEFRNYKTLMKKYFTMPEEEIAPVYYVDNYYCTNMMMDALSYLYEYRADFEEMIGYMKQAQPNQYFRAGVTEYEVAHKYGAFEGMVNDVGIIYTPQPFLLAVYTKFVGEHVVAEVAKLFTAYNLSKEPPELPKTMELEVQFIPEEVSEPEAVEPEVIEPEDPEIIVQPEEPEPVAFEWWMPAIAIGVFLLGGGIVLLALKPKKREDDHKE